MFVSELMYFSQRTLMHFATSLTPYHALLDPQFVLLNVGVREGWKEEMKDAKFKGRQKTAQCEMFGSLVKKGGEERRKCEGKGESKGARW